MRLSLCGGKKLCMNPKLCTNQKVYEYKKKLCGTKKLRENKKFCENKKMAQWQEGVRIQNKKLLGVGEIATNNNQWHLGVRSVVTPTGGLLNAPLLLGAASPIVLSFAGSSLVFLSCVGCVILEGDMCTLNFAALNSISNTTTY